ncbi:MAG: AraC family transcriptional regulator [Woeseiaceae bacterium]|nr:AraC family transcriptional regulator [Woeseiaceae bacterium]
MRRVSFDTVARNRIHRHSYFEPCIVISGAGDFEHGAERYALGPGDLFLADPGVYHEIRSLKSRDLKLYFVSFQIAIRRSKDRDRSAALTPQSLITSFLARHRTHLTNQSDVIPLFEYLYEIATGDDAFEQSANYRDASLLLIRHVMSALTSSASLSAGDYSDRQQKSRVQRAIEARLHESFRIEELARACGMSERTLRRRWRSWSSRSLSDEINHRRIERACQLLMLPDLAIGEIGYQVGVSSPARFSRLFRDLKGLSAREYRQQVMRETAHAMSGSNQRMTEYLDD